MQQRRKSAQMMTGAASSLIGGMRSSMVPESPMLARDKSLPADGTPHPTAAQHKLGVMLCVLSAVCLGSDGMLVKLAVAGGATTASALVFKMAFATLGLALVLCVDSCFFRPKNSGPLVPTKSGLLHIVLAAIGSALVQIGFTLGFRYTKSANVLAFTSLSPIWGALISRVVLKEPMLPRTVVASALSLVGALVVVVGIEMGADSSEPMMRTIIGSAFGLLTGVANAAQLCVVKSSVTNAPGTEMLLSALVAFAGATLTGLALTPQLHPAGIPFVPSVISLAYLCVDGLCMVGALSSLTAAARLIPPAEGALILQLEAVLGPLSCFLALHEVPSSYTLAGGIVVLLAVAGHEAVSLTAELAEDEEPRTQPLISD
jgi:drug/metabolite transporter (DMT)-like permease